MKSYFFLAIFFSLAIACSKLTLAASEVTSLQKSIDNYLNCDDPIDLGITDSVNACTESLQLPLSVLWSDDAFLLPAGGTWSDPNGNTLPQGFIIPTSGAIGGDYTYNFINDEGCTAFVTLTVFFQTGSFLPSFTLNLCEDNPPFVPYDFLEGFSPILGNWVYFNNSNEFISFYLNYNFVFDPGSYNGGGATVQDGYLVYYSANPICGISQDTIFISTQNQFNFAETICVGGDNVNLDSLLSEFDEPAGAWFNTEDEPIPGMLNPQSLLADSLYLYFWEGTQGGCSTTADASITFQFESDTIVNETACLEYFWLPANETLTESGQYTTVLTNTAGCDSTVTLNLVIADDTEAPVFDCPELIEVYSDFESCGVPVDYDIPLAIDGCDEAEITLIEGLNPLEVFPPGETLVTYQAIDPSGNFSTCAFTVNVIDTIRPVVLCESGSKALNAGDTLIVNLNNAGTATDNCQIDSESLSQSQFTLADLGVTSVTYSASDESGNIGQCVFEVEVTPCVVNAGTISTTDVTADLCVQDQFANNIQVDIEGQEGNIIYTLIDGGDLDIVERQFNNTFFMNTFPAQNYRIAAVAYEDISEFYGVTNLSQLEGCFDVSNFIAVSTVNVDGGFIWKNQPNPVCTSGAQVSYSLAGEAGDNFAWAIFDESFENRLATNNTGVFNIPASAPAGQYKVVHVAFNDGSAIGEFTVGNIPECIDVSNAVNLELTNCPEIALSSYPNPVSDNSTVSFNMVETGFVLLELYDSSGRCVKTVYEGLSEEGVTHLYEVYIGVLPPGVYVYKLSTVGGVFTERVIVGG